LLFFRFVVFLGEPLGGRSLAGELFADEGVFHGESVAAKTTVVDMLRNLVEIPHIEQLTAAGAFHEMIALGFGLTEIEVVRLYGIVVSRYENLKCDVRQFRRAMLALCFARRQKTLNAQFYPDHWLGDCKVWLARHGFDHEITPFAHAAAVIASGIPFSDPIRFPIDTEFALARGDVSKPVATWRSVLEAGRLPAPTPLDRPTVRRTVAQTLISPHNPVRAERQSTVRVDQS
jgi:hypothetical protein